MLPRNYRQEGLSRAYVRAIAAFAGVSVTVPENDFGIDLYLREVIEENGFFDAGLGRIDAQLKSTTLASVTATEVIYDLGVRAYNNLRRSDDNNFRLLILLALPEEESEWLTCEPEQLILRRCAYWINLRGLPSTGSTASIRIRIPTANIFTTTSLLQLLEQSRQGAGNG